MAVLRAFALFAVLHAAAAAGAGDTEIAGRIAALRQLVEADDKQLKNMMEGAARKLADDDEDGLPGTVIALPPPGDTLYGDEPETVVYSSMDSNQGALDHMWLILCGALVMIMQAGFAMMASGLCRVKSVQSCLLINLVDLSMTTIGWFCVGYAFAFGGPYDPVTTFKKHTILGIEGFAGEGFVTRRDDGQYEPHTQIGRWFFEWASCCVAGTIVAGGVLERISWPGILIFSLFFSAVIYPLIAAATWGRGFLATIHDTGYFDFGGSGVIHFTGGMAALMGAIIAGPRKKRFQDSYWERMTEYPERFDPHSLPLSVLGTFVLWFGWYGLNGGRVGHFHTVEQAFLAGHVAMNMTLSAACGGLLVFMMRYAMTNKYDIISLCGGILAGLVSISAGVANVESGVACFAGLIGGMIYLGVSCLLKRVGVDDPVDAFAIHGACGMWAVVYAAFFDMGVGFDAAHGPSGGWRCFGHETGSCEMKDKHFSTQMVVANLAGIATIIAWSGILSAVVFAILKVFGLLGDKTPDSPEKEEDDDEPLQSI